MWIGPYSRYTYYPPNAGLVLWVAHPVTVRYCATRALAETPAETLFSVNSWRNEKVRFESQGRGSHASSLHVRDLNFQSRDG
jgi:hypothetical protein